MAGRKKLQLTWNDLSQVFEHLEDLPFKRKIEAEFYTVAEVKSFGQLEQKELEMLKKCRYEMNSYNKKMHALEKLKIQKSHSSFEKEILELSEKKDIDSHFLLLESLTLFLKKADTKTAENKLKNIKKRLEDKTEDSETSIRKQKDREKYFMGAFVLELLQKINLGHSDRADLQKVIDVFESALVLQKFENKFYSLDDFKEKNRLKDLLIPIYEKFNESDRNPFKKTEKF